MLSGTVLDWGCLGGGWFGPRCLRCTRGHRDRRGFRGSRGTRAVRSGWGGGGGGRTGGGVGPGAVIAAIAAVAGAGVAVAAVAAVAAGVRLLGGVAVGVGIEGEDHAAAVAALARRGERLEQAGAHPLPGHLDQAERGHLGDLVLGPV